MSESEFDPSVSLSEALAEFVIRWKVDFRDHWGLDEDEPSEGTDPEQWKHRKLMDRLAKLCIHSAKTLEDSNGDLIRLLMLFDQHLGVMPLQDEFLAQCVEIELADDLDDELENRVVRTLQLIPYATRVQSHRARAYLHRVAHCYTLGLRTETVIMCGAVLDAALQEHISEPTLRAAGKPNQDHFTLKHRIDYLSDTGQLTAQLVKKARQVSRERNDAVHNAPGTTVDPLRCLGDLADVLEAIFPDETQQIN